MSEKINWGILGLGKIANKFVQDLLLFEKANLYGVASRNSDKAKEFSQKYKAVKHYGSYRELAQDPEVDIIYIATPHTLHFENTMMCLREGKSVLCEKPLGINANQVKTMIAESKSRKLFLMEALWTRFIPATEKMLELVESGKIGDINFMRADFGIKADTNPQGRVYNKKLGGGSLLDIGIYPVYLSLLLIGVPIDIKAMARMSETEVDSYCAMLFDYENGEKAILESTFEAETPTEAYIYGNKGRIKMHTRFHQANRISLFLNDGSKEVFDIEYKGCGYYHEIEEVTQCLTSGKIESKKLPHSISMNLITLLDQIKQKIGLRYDTD